MYKVILIARFSDVTKEINETLSTFSQVQLCSYNEEVIRGILSLTQPDLAVFSMVSSRSVDNSVFTLLRQEQPKMRILALGSHTDIEEAVQFDYWVRDHVEFLERPVKAEEIAERAKQMLAGEEDGRSGREAPAAQPAQPQQSQQSQQKKTILVVDDNPTTLRTMQGMLQQYYRVTFALSGPKAIEIVLKKKPDLILLDYNMPKFDGKMTLEMLRSMDETKDIPVIFLTGMSTREHVESILSLRPSGYLLKPPSEERVLSEVAQALEEAEKARKDTYIPPSK